MPPLATTTGDWHIRAHTDRLETAEICGSQRPCHIPLLGTISIPPCADGSNHPKTIKNQIRQSAAYRCIPLTRYVAWLSAAGIGHPPRLRRISLPHLRIGMRLGAVAQRSAVQ